MTNILFVHTSPRAESLSANLAKDIIEKIKSQKTDVNVINRDLSTGLPFVNEQTIGAAYTPAEQRTEDQNKCLNLSEELIGELEQTDTLIIATPMWNFSCPASLKAWFDLIARPARTFKFRPEGGYDGLLKNRKTYLVITTGGVPIDSAMDFLTPLVKTNLGFIGITDIEVIAAVGTNLPNAAENIEVAKAAIRNIAA